MGRDRKPSLLRRMAITWGVMAVAIAIVGLAFPGITVDWGSFSLLAIAAVWGLVDALLGTILRILTVPLKIVTLGLISIAVNFAVFATTTLISDRISSDGVLPVFLGSIVLGLLGAVGLRITHAKN